MIRIFLTNLAKYNEGELVGEWIELPIEEEELQEAIKDILGEDEEFFITDYEGIPSISEYESPYKLNDIALELQKHDVGEVTLRALMEVIGDIEQALEVIREQDYFIVEDVSSYKELAQKEGVEGFLPFCIFEVEQAGALPYIDFEQVGRELDIMGWYIFRDEYYNGYAVKILD